MTAHAYATEIQPGDEIRTRTSAPFTVHAAERCDCTDHFDGNPEHYRLLPAEGPGLVIPAEGRVLVLNRSEGELENRATEENEARIATEIETMYAEIMYRIDELSDLSGVPSSAGVAYELYQRLQHRERGGYVPAP